MKKLVVVVAILVVVFTLSVGVAFAHPEQAQAGLANAQANAGDDPQIAVATTALGKSGGANLNGVLQQPAHNPHCTGHAHAD